MTDASTSTPAFFEAKYQRETDPWKFSTDHTELTRYDTILTALSHRRYRKAFEPGCSVGVLTEKLAAISDAVEAIDFSPTALARAGARCKALPQVQFHCQSLANYLPSNDFDLLVFSEVGYYFDLPEWADLSGAHVNAADPGTTVLACHWLGVSEDHRLSGDQVHTVLRANPQLRLEHEERHATFRLDRWVRV